MSRSCWSFFFLLCLLLVLVLVSFLLVLCLIFIDSWHTHTFIYIRSLSSLHLRRNANAPFVYILHPFAIIAHLLSNLLFSCDCCDVYLFFFLLFSAAYWQFTCSILRMMRKLKWCANKIELATFCACVSLYVSVRSVAWTIVVIVGFVLFFRFLFRKALARSLLRSLIYFHSDKSIKAFFFQLPHFIPYRHGQ